jgi:hypothetical protein
MWTSFFHYALHILPHRNIENLPTKMRFVNNFCAAQNPDVDDLDRTPHTNT